MTDSLNDRLGRRAFVLLAGVLVLGAGVTCTEHGGSPVAPDGLPGVDARVAIAASRDTARMLIGTTLQLSSRVLNPQGHALPNKEHSSWMSSNPTVATVDPTGLVTAIDSGQTFVVALYKNTADSVRVHVVPVPVARVVLTPATLTLDVGESDTVAATTLDSIGGVLNGRRIEWSSSSTNVATVDATGIVTAQHVGTAWIRAASEGKSDSLTATVEAPHLSVVTGPPPSGTVGAALPQPLVVRVTGRSGRSLQGTPVVFASVRGGGTLSPSPAITDADGRASAQWVLGTTAGRDSATASVTGADPLGFGVDALAGDPAHVTYVSGSGQSGIIDQRLAEPLVVRATDQYGNLVRSVQWSSAAGNPVQDSVATNGNLYATWTVTRVGTDTALALAGGDTARFVATVSLGGPPTLLEVVGPSYKTGQIGSTVTFSVRALDAFGNGVSGADVEWAAVRGAGGGFTHISTRTGPDGVASNDWQLKFRAGAKSATATLANGAAVTLSVRATPGPVNGLEKVSGDGQSGQAPVTLPESLVVRAVDQGGNAVPGASISWDGGGTGTISPSSAVTDANGLASAQWTLTQPGQAFATARESSSGRSMTFAAAGTPLSGPTLTIVSGNGQTQMGMEYLSPLVVQLKDANGLPVAGAQVTWTSTPEAYAISAYSPTDSAGRTTANVQLPGSAGPLTIWARSGAAGPAVFSATVLRGPWCNSNVVLDGPSTAAPGATVTVWFIATDLVGTLAPGASFGDRLTVSDGGSVTWRDSIPGIRIGTWTLGSKVGTQTLSYVFNFCFGRTLKSSFPYWGSGREVIYMKVVAP